MNILCTICVRAGSKGLRGKNFLKIGKKNLITYTLEKAKKSNLFDQITVSTDSKKIKNIKKKNKKVFFIKRPKYLASDKASKLDAIRHALILSEKQCNKKFDITIDLDATSPLRSVSDIRSALKIFKKTNSDNLFSVNESRKNPYFNMVELDNKKVRLVKKYKKNLNRRQDAPITYDMNASIYIWKRPIILRSNNLFRKKTSIYIMPQERSIDIDNKFELNMVKCLIKK